MTIWDWALLEYVSLGRHAPAIVFELRSLMSGAASMRTISLFSFATMSFGVAAGATTPNQPIASKPGTPDSTMVGTEGNALARFALVTASALMRPDFTYGLATTMFSKLIAIWPPITSAMA